MVDQRARTSLSTKATPSLCTLSRNLQGGIVVRNRFDIHAAVHERLTSGFTTLTSFDMDYRVRSIVFAAGWFAAHATEHLVVESGVRRIFLSGKNNGVNPLDVSCHASRTNIGESL